MPSSRLTKKRQTTIPKDICTFLDIDSGDSVTFTIEGDDVIVRKSSPLDLEHLRALDGTLSSEWLSKEDSNAYDDL